MAQPVQPQEAVGSGVVELLAKLEMSVSADGGSWSQETHHEPVAAVC